MYRLIALDVDGTLLDSAHRLSPAVRASVQAAQARGAVVCLATGKLLASVRGLLAELGVAGEHITCNGAALMDARTGEAVATWALASDQRRAALTAIREAAPDLPIAWYTTDAIYADAPTGPLDTILAAYQEPPVRHVARLDDTLPPPLKLLMSGEHAQLLALREALRARLGDTATVVRTTADFLEVMAPGVSKGEALDALARRHGVARDEIVAIGDGENDISLMEVAGVGVAMGNAMPALRARASHFTTSNDADGVARALEALGLAPPLRGPVDAAER